MTVEEKVQDGVGVLTLAGDFDTPDVKRLEAAVASLISRGVVRVAVSLEKLTFINSTGLGSLIRENERLTQAGGGLACAALSTFAEKNFRLLGMDKRIRCFFTAWEAAAWLRGGGEGAEAGPAARVAFRFADEGPKGKDRRAEALDFGEQGLSFRLENLEGLDPESAFRVGRELLLGPAEGPAARGKIQAAEAATGRKVVVRVAFVRGNRAEEEAAARLVGELRAARGPGGTS